MSTYAIAGAIEKLTESYKTAIKEKNQIERERLMFEKEKFEFAKKKEEERKYNKEECKLANKEECEHEWEMIGSSLTSSGVTYLYTCSKCGKRKSTPVIGL